MKAHLNSDSPMRNGKSSNQAGANGYAPSVPISVYRELAAELQASKAMLDSLNAQNQQLTKQNQQLRKEIELVVQSALQLRQVAESSQPMGWGTASEDLMDSSEFVAELNRTEPIRSQPIQRPAQRIKPQSTANVDVFPSPQKNKSPESIGLSNELFTEQEEGHRPTSSPTRASDTGGTWLAITIFLIIVSAFGTGFLIVRPLLPSR